MNKRKPKENKTIELKTYYTRSWSYTNSGPIPPGDQEAGIKRRTNGHQGCKASGKLGNITNDRTGVIQTVQKRQNGLYNECKEGSSEQTRSKTQQGAIMVVKGGFRFPIGCGVPLPSAGRGRRRVAWCVPCQVHFDPACSSEVETGEVGLPHASTVGGGGS